MRKIKIVNVNSAIMPLIVFFVGFLWGNTVVGQSSVVCGADRLFSEYFHLIKDKKVALVGNHSSVLQDGKHLADTLFAHPETQLLALFGMEFNIRSNDYSIRRDEEETIDEATGVPKYSLYGHTHKPSPEMLAGTEVLIFDMQEVGVRFYEHVNILGFVMEAAAEQDIPLLILDRPNPITGLRVDGFLPEAFRLRTFGSYGNIPVLHGMTLGELSRLYNEEMRAGGRKEAQVKVVEMKGWQRRMWFEETGISWRKPSPNLLHMDAVLAYTGTCLFEGTNISEGRGTDHPFQLIGAPWVNAEAVIQLLNRFSFRGVKFHPVNFVPEKKAHLSKPPKQSGLNCSGVFIEITDREQFDSYRVGIALLWAIHSLHREQVEWKESNVQRLTATNRFLAMLQAGDHPEKIYESWKDELNEFKEKRKKYLIYE